MPLLCSSLLKRATTQNQNLNIPALQDSIMNWQNTLKTNAGTSTLTLDPTIKDPRLSGLLTGHREINEEAQKNQLLWIEFRNEEKELKRFKHQSQKLDITQAKSISKKHPQRRK
ncbi:hypothetical protein BY996DRAFT_6590559 [Phakopsora pachyrhizi]|nr:hypothetical protein BY996DRAFT_6590559 [Phakopsora pachyrhizi]